MATPFQTMLRMHATRSIGGDTRATFTTRKVLTAKMRWFFSGISSRLPRGCRSPSSDVATSPRRDTGIPEVPSQDGVTTIRQQTLQFPEEQSVGTFFGLLPTAGVRSPVWLDDDRILAAAEDRGDTHLYELDIAGSTPKLTPDLVEIYRHDWAYDSRRAATELGYAPRALATGLGETFAWLRSTPEWATTKARK